MPEQGRGDANVSRSGAVAQLVAHLVRNEGVRGSSPLSSTDERSTDERFTDERPGRWPRWQIPIVLVSSFRRRGGWSMSSTITRLSGSSMR